MTMLRFCAGGDAELILCDRGDTPLSSSHASLESALSELLPCTRTFLIGGSQLYNLSLKSPPLVDRILLTRVISDVECDTFLTDFVSQQDEKGEKMWTQSTHSELEQWVGFDVPSGEVEEKGFRYRFEMWVLAIPLQ